MVLALTACHGAKGQRLRSLGGVLIRLSSGFVVVTMKR
jgi:hypothetical protein